MEILDKILDASEELFSQYGFKTITMDDIARQSGISKKTLYLHFANKEEVVNESVLWHKRKTSSQCAYVLENAENAVEAMVKMMVFFDEMNRKMNPVALFELHRYYPDAYRTFKKQLEEKDVHMMRDNLCRGIKEGLFRPEIDADLMARYRLETSLLIFQPNLMVSDRNSLISVALVISEHFMYGLMTPAGIELYKQYKLKYLKNIATI